MPIVVAINKMDKEDAQPDRVKQQLTEEGLQPVEWGGKIEMVPVSARTGDGIDQAARNRAARSRSQANSKPTRIAARPASSSNRRSTGAAAPSRPCWYKTARCASATSSSSAAAYGKIRALIDDKGKQVKKAGPSIPVEIMGLSDVPAAGDTLMVVSDERAAREAAAKRTTKRRDVRIAATSGPRVSLETFMQMPADGGQKDAQPHPQGRRPRLGRSAALARRSALQRLKSTSASSSPASAVSRPTTSTSRRASNAVLIGFNIRPDETVKRLAENEQVDLRFYQVIYDVENDLKKAMVGMLAPKFREIILGRAEVREIFKVSQGRDDRRLLRPVRQAHAQLQGSRDARLGGRLGWRDSSRCGASRTTCAKLLRTSSAAFRLPSSPISSRAT